MRWFKHMTRSNRDEKLTRVKDEFGLEGYGLYWLILEIIAEQMNENNKTFVEFSVKTWRTFTGFSTKKLKKYLTFFSELKLFFVEFSQNSIKIDCPNLLKYRDEYSRKKNKKSGQSQERVRTKSGESQDKVAPDTDTDTDTDTEKKKGENIPSCPHKKIIELYHKILPELPKVKKWHSTRQKLLQARWQEDKTQQSLKFWEYFFHKVRKSDFLMGKVVTNNGRCFKADLEWLIRPTNFTKVLEGRYDNQPKEKPKPRTPDWY